MNRPIRIGVIGAGTFASAFLNQAKQVPGMQIVSVADLDGEKAKKACITAGWPEASVASVTPARVSMRVLLVKGDGHGQCRSFDTGRSGGDR